MHFVISVESPGQGSGGKGKGKDSIRQQTPQKQESDKARTESQRGKTGESSHHQVKESSYLPAEIIAVKQNELKEEIIDLPLKKE